MHKNKSGGFSLIELMVSVAIVAILAGVAVPAYQNHMVTSRRTDAQRVMVEWAQAMERYYTANGSYANGANCGVAQPSTVSMYGIACSLSAGGGFSLTATPTSSSAQASDGNLTLDNTGARTPTAKWKM